MVMYSHLFILSRLTLRIKPDDLLPELQVTGRERTLRAPVRGLATTAFCQLSTLFVISVGSGGLPVDHAETLDIPDDTTRSES